MKYKRKQTNAQPRYFSGKTSRRGGCLSVNVCKLLDLKHLSISADKERICSVGDREALIVLLAGTIRVATRSGKTVLGPRRDVFSDKSHSLYLSAPGTCRISARSASAECVVITVHKTAYRSAGRMVLPPARVATKTVGRGTYRRTVHTLFPPRSGKGRCSSKQPRGSVNLIVGETFNDDGKWSSFPPHKHARMQLPHECRYEEIYFFKVRPADGFGLMRIYDDTAGTSGAYCIKDNDCCVVSDGYHPVGALPGCRVYYLWAMAGTCAQVKTTVDAAFRQRGS